LQEKPTVPTYQYHCAANGRSLEVKHRMSETLSTWGELCTAAGLASVATPADSPIAKVLAPTFVAGGGKSEVSPPASGGGGHCQLRGGGVTGAAQMEERRWLADTAHRRDHPKGRACDRNPALMVRVCGRSTRVAQSEKKLLCLHGWRAHECQECERGDDETEHEGGTFRAGTRSGKVRDCR
jgi:hypothetical protein